MYELKGTGKALSSTHEAIASAKARWQGQERVDYNECIRMQNNAVECFKDLCKPRKLQKRKANSGILPFWNRSTENLLDMVGF